MKGWVWIAVLVLALLHQDFWLWDDATLVAGFLPIGLAYHAAYYRSLKDAGFDGVVSLKTAGSSPDGPLVAVRQSWAALCGLLRRIG